MQGGYLLINILIAMKTVFRLAPKGFPNLMNDAWPPCHYRLKAQLPLAN